MMRGLFLIFLSVFVFSISVKAQVFTNPRPPVVNVDPWVNLRIGQIGNQISADMVRNQALKNRAKTATKIRNKTTTNKTSQPKNYSTIYKKEFSFARSDSSVLAQKLAENQRGNKEENLRKMNMLISQVWSNYETSYKEENEKLKMPYNDVATVMTYYISANYMRLNDVNYIEPEKTAAMYEQLSGVLLKDDTFFKLKPEEKQLMAEFLLLTGDYPLMVFNQNRIFGELKKKSKENLARIFGDNADKMKITENGIEF